MPHSLETRRWAIVARSPAPRKARSSRALERIWKQSGDAFDPKIVQALRSGFDRFPVDLQSVPVPVKADQRFELIAVQRFDGDVQPVLGIDSMFWRDRVVDEFGPAVFLEGVENCGLVERRNSEALHHLAVVAKLAMRGVPDGLPG